MGVQQISFFYRFSIGRVIICAYAPEDAMTEGSKPEQLPEQEEKPTEETTAVEG
jgi:hypothetical protein